MIIIVLLLNSCNDQEKKDLHDSTINYLLEGKDIFKVDTIKGNIKTTKRDIELQVYQSFYKKKFLNQAIEYERNGNIDTLNSHFFRLELNEITKNNFKCKIWLNYEGEIIKEIDLKILSYKEGKPIEMSFISNNSNEISFDFVNENSEATLVGVLCIKIETEMEDQTTTGYYKRYMFVDSHDLTDNIFIKKYKKFE